MQPYSSQQYPNLPRCQDSLQHIIDKLQLPVQAEVVKQRHLQDSGSHTADHLNTGQVERLAHGLQPASTGNGQQGQHQAGLNPNTPCLRSNKECMHSLQLDMTQKACRCHSTHTNKVRASL